MTTTPQLVFDLAMAAMDSLQEGTGLADYGTTLPYRQRTLPILTLLQGQCLALLPREVDLPPTPPLPQFNTTLPLPDDLCQGVIPYGLAAHLLLEEAPNAAAFFQQRYEEGLRAWQGRQLATISIIQPPYGGIELGEFGGWG